MAVIIGITLILIVFILLFIYSLMRISSREDDLAEQEKYMKQLLEKKKERGELHEG